MSKIAVIGAQVPDFQYDSSMGFRVGNIIAKMMRKGDVMMTGGVEGVGLDSFMGYAATLSHGEFTCVIPQYIQIKKGKDEWLEKPYALPESYQVVSEITGRKVDVIFKGNSMIERREALAGMVDLAIVMNGSMGTFHEAVMLLENNIPVISIPSSGGVAMLLGDYANSDDEHVREFFGPQATIPNIKNLSLVSFASFKGLEGLLKTQFLK